VVVLGYDHLADSQRQYLQAYGILPGRSVCVIARTPVTIVQVEQTELAFENEIAKRVIVQ